MSINISPKIRRSFNQPNSLIAISNFPKKTEIYSKGVDATASFTKNSLLAIRKSNPKRKIIILTSVIEKNTDYDSYLENGMLVIRCFKRNSIISFLSLFHQILKFNQISLILFEFEFASFGNTKTSIFIPLLLASFSLLGKKIHLVLHQVVLNLKEIHGHLGLNSKSMNIKILSFGLNLYYKLICSMATSIIVLEDVIKKRLEKLGVNRNKIFIIHHGIDKCFKKASKKESRIQIGINKNEFVLLFFGYMTWYKGADFLVKALLKTKSINGKKIRLIMAGGPSETQKNKLHYQNYFERIRRLIKNKKHISLTGFLAEKDISAYFACSDLVVFPYRFMISSSGAFATASAFEKPFIISDSLKHYFSNSNMSQNLKDLNLKESDFIFPLNKDSLVQTIKKNQNSVSLNKLALLSKKIKKQRSFSALAQQYNQLFKLNKNSRLITPKEIIYNLSYINGQHYKKTYFPLSSTS